MNTQQYRNAALILLLGVALGAWYFLKPQGPEPNQVATVITDEMSEQSEQVEDTVTDTTDALGADDSASDAVVDEPDTDAVDTVADMTDTDQGLITTDDASDVTDTESVLTVRSLVLATGQQMRREGRKVGGKHRGHIDVVTGEMSIQGDRIMSGQAIVDMTTLVIDDITDADSNADLLTKLQTEFFDIETYPTAMFVVTSSDVEDGDRFVIGDLTINGQTNTIRIPVEIERDGDDVVLVADFAIERTVRGLDAWAGIVDEFMYFSFSLHFTDDA